MILPTSKEDDEIAAINNSDVDRQAIIAPTTTPSDDREDLAVEIVELLLRSKYDETEDHCGQAHIPELLTEQSTSS
ncbi:unnamed protein product [Schistocephalus solidus]|uniref:LacI family transcriptional regulator n=1 Tax=Schistocephalus solidus TaxID=70667 RepID=A0A183SHM0_SCHSO|nr:unnamed protein product [Schistocephalus solidus]